MPAHDVRFHPKFPQVPLVRWSAPEAGGIVCDVSEQPAKAGDVVWGNRCHDVDVLDAHMEPAAAVAGSRGVDTAGLSAAPAAPGRLPGTCVEAATRAGVEILLAVQAEKGRCNAFVSPASIFLALSMTAAGARGSTRDAMAAAMCTSQLGPPDAIHGQMQPVRSALVSSDGRVVVKAANSLWSAVLHELFVKECAEAFGAEAKVGPPQPAAINHWCAEKTQGKIGQVLDPQMPLDPRGAVLVNAIYFKGAWRVRFDERATVNSTFHSDAGPQPCKMMTAQGDAGKFGYHETSSLQAAMLPYGDKGEFSAVVVLPRQGVLPSSVASGLAHDWADVTGSLAMRKGTLKLPRFKLDCSIDLVPILQQRGMAVAFTPAADFSGMSGEPLYITQVVHKTFVEVTEEGTEAAAVTAVVMSRCLVARPEPSFVMECDRPFIFCIRHNPSNAMLFCGIIESV